MTKNVIIHTIPDTSPEKQRQFVDGGLLIADLAQSGLGVIIASRDSYETGVVTRASYRQGMVGLEECQMPLDALGESHSLYSRTIAPLTKSKLVEGVPKLNANEVKVYGSDKSRVYEDVAKNLQVPTTLLPIDPDEFQVAKEMIEAVDAKEVVLKPNSGFGGSSVKILEKADAIEFMSKRLQQDGSKQLIVQPKVEFGAVPDGIVATTDNGQALLTRARQDKLLTELRVFCLKNNDTYTTVPVLRVVADKSKRMGHDIYVDVELADDLEQKLYDSTTGIVEGVARNAGNIGHVLAAADYYFDTNGSIGLNEANFRSPELPVTAELHRAGRSVHKALSLILTSMNSGETA